MRPEAGQIAFCGHRPGSTCTPDGAQRNQWWEREAPGENSPLRHPATWTHGCPVTHSGRHLIHLHSGLTPPDRGSERRNIAKALCGQNQAVRGEAVCSVNMPGTD